MPVGEYFRKYIEKVAKGAMEENESSQRLEMGQLTEKIGMKTSAEQLVAIKKIWLTEFHRWIMANCNETTCEHMDELLKAESDWESLQIVYNSFNQASLGSGSAAGKEQ